MLCLSCSGSRRDDRRLEAWGVSGPGLMPKSHLVASVMGMEASFFGKRWLCHFLSGVLHINPSRRYFRKVSRYTSQSCRGGRRCLVEGRLGFPGRACELRFGLSFPFLLRENRSSKNVWENAWKSQTVLLPDICDQPTWFLSWYFCKNMHSCWFEVVHTSPICMTYHYTRKITPQKIFGNSFSEMCNDIPRNRLHEKMFGELTAEELYGTLSHINCTPASIACFGELAGYKSVSTCCATWVPKMHMANLGIFLVVWVPRAQNAGKYEKKWDVQPWKWSHLSFWLFSQVL